MMRSSLDLFTLRVSRFGQKNCWIQHQTTAERLFADGFFLSVQKDCLIHGPFANQQGHRIGCLVKTRDVNGNSCHEIARRIGLPREVDSFQEELKAERDCGKRTSAFSLQ